MWEEYKNKAYIFLHNALINILYVKFCLENLYTIGLTLHDVSKQKCFLDFVIIYVIYEIFFINITSILTISYEI